MSQGCAKIKVSVASADTAVKKDSMVADVNGATTDTGIENLKVRSCTCERNGQYLQAGPSLCVTASNLRSFIS